MSNHWGAVQTLAQLERIDGSRRVLPHI